MYVSFVAAELEMELPSVFGNWMRSRRGILGLSQLELSRRTGIAQSHISAFETGKSIAGEKSRQKIVDALKAKPSLAVANKRDEIVTVFSRANLTDPQIFGSVAKGCDTESSDIDFLATFPVGHNLLDTARVVHQLQEITTFPVEVYNPEYHKRKHPRWFQEISQDVVSI